MTSVNKTCYKNQMGHVLTCHSLRMHFWLFSLVFKGNIQNHRLIFKKCHFSNFCKNIKFPKTQNVLLLFCYCHGADHLYNENSLNNFCANDFFPKIMQFYAFCPKKFAISFTLLNMLQNQRFDNVINQKLC